VCRGTGAGLRVLGSVCRQPVTGVDFSAGLLAQPRSAHPDAGWVPADARALPFAGVPGGVFAFRAAAPPPVTAGRYRALPGFDLAMRVRNALWRPPFVISYRTSPLPAVRSDLTASRFTVTTLPLTAPGPGSDGNPRCQLVLARKTGTP
jgi:hypothetical protein